MADQFHTEGYIKEIKVDGQGISVKLDPSERFSFGENESNDKKIILLETGSEDKAVFVAQSVEFKFDSGVVKAKNFDTDFLFSLKKDRAKLRVSVQAASNPASATGSKSPASVDEPDKNEVSKITYTITSITIL